MWCVLTNQQQQIGLHFLIPEHIKFAPDWCFGLLKQRFRQTEVSNLMEQELSSTLVSANLPHMSQQNI